MARRSFCNRKTYEAACKLLRAMQGGGGGRTLFTYQDRTVERDEALPDGVVELREDDRVLCSMTLPQPILVDDTVK